jgi:hypothetical protein
MRARNLPLPLAFGLSQALSGCALFSFEPAMELVKAGGLAVSHVVSTAPGRASDTVHHAGPKPSSVCISHNPMVSSGEVVPALQTALAQAGVSSRVYAADTTPLACPVWLLYSGTVTWDAPPFGSEHRAYLASAQLTLKTMHGQVLASSAYGIDGLFESSKWATTQDKLSPVVQALLTGFGG